MSAELQSLVKALKEQYPDVRPGYSVCWPHPSLLIVDCVLSLNRHYDRVVVPRVNEFAAKNPGVKSVADLDSHIRSFASPLEFSINELRYNHEDRARILAGVVTYLIAMLEEYPGKTEMIRLKKWAVAVRPGDHISVGVGGFGLSGFQYLRMLFGADTTKPDIHIRRFVGESIGRAVNDVAALNLLEQAARVAKLPLRELDSAIWNDRARGE